MTNDEKIKGHFSAIAECAGNLQRNFDPERVVENDEVAQYLQKQLGAIKSLLEPKSIASSVLRLTNICNELGRENAILRNDLTDMTLNYNAAEKHARLLEEECVRKDDELIVTIRSNIWLRERLTFKDESLRACRAAEKVLKHDLEQANWDATKLKRKLARRDAHLTRVQSRLEWIKQGLEGRSVEVENRKLKRDLDKIGHELETARRRLATQERYIEILKEEDRRQALERTEP